MEQEQCLTELEKCCGARNWTTAMENARPFRSRDHMISVAGKIWNDCNLEDALEAFSDHPKIGDRENLAKKFASTREWAAREQGGVSGASLETLNNLAEMNRLYEEKFGYIFIVYATGKSADEMLALLRERFENNLGSELEIAKKEQHKITKLRLRKLIPMSQITTHVLDTARGCPAEGIKITLQKPGSEAIWIDIKSGVTNEDGRISNLLSGEVILDPGTYRMYFETNAYFDKLGMDNFYPYVAVVFQINDEKHYHIPLLLSPFGYSTYRGS